MTKEEAYKRLDLQEGTDLNQVRKQFSAMHSDYRMRIDNAPTPRLRQLFEQQLEEIKEAYALINGSDGVDDTGDLPRTGRVTMDTPLKENNEKDTRRAQQKEKASYSLGEAFAYFGGTADTSQSTLKSAYESKIKPLKKLAEEQVLPQAKEIYVKEIAKTNALWLLIENHFKEKAKQDLENKKVQSKSGKSQQQTSASNSSKATTQSGKKKSAKGIIVTILSLILLGFFLFRFVPSLRRGFSNEGLAVEETTSYERVTDRRIENQNPNSSKAFAYLIYTGNIEKNTQLPNDSLATAKAMDSAGNELWTVNCTFKDGLPNGNGEIIYSDYQKKYWKDNSMVINKNYKGWIRNGLPNGLGTLYLENGKFIKGEFNMGNLAKNKDGSWSIIDTDVPELK